MTRPDLPMMPAFSFPPLREKIAFTGTSLFRIILDRAGNDQTKRVLTPADFPKQKISADGEETICEYECEPTGEGGRIRVVVELKRCPEQVLGTISVDSQGPFRVRQVQFPYIEKEHVHRFDSLLMSSAWGDNIPRPVRTIQQYCLGKNSGFWIYDYIKCGDNEVIYTYPSIMAMQFMALHNKSRTIYLASYSTGDDTMTFNAGVHGKTGLALSVNHYPFLEKGRVALAGVRFRHIAGGLAFRLRSLRRTHGWGIHLSRRPAMDECRLEWMGVGTDAVRRERAQLPLQ